MTDSEAPTPPTPPTSPQDSIDSGLFDKLVKASNQIYEATKRNSSNWIRTSERRAREMGLIPPKKSPLRQFVEGVFEEEMPPTHPDPWENEPVPMSPQEFVERLFDEPD